MYLCRTPTPPLDAFVAHLWVNDRPALGHARERGLPTGRADLVIALGQPHVRRFDDAADRVGRRFHHGVLQGPRDCAFLRDTSQASSVVGVHFCAGGAPALLHMPLGGLANQVVSLDELWGPAAHRLREQLLDAPHPAERLQTLERWLLRRLANANAALLCDPAIRFAVRQFDAHPSNARVATVRGATGWSIERFNRRFRDAVGMTPKRYLRVRRFQALLGAIASGGDDPWVQRALDAGYADQPHLVHEFGRLAGLTPSAYRPLSQGRHNHVIEPP